MEQKALERPPGYELFFAPLAIALEPNEYEEVQFAYFASKFGHAGQKREDGTRYFDHPKSATWIYIDELCGRDVRTIVDTLLHDLGEDTYLLSPYRIARNFGEDIALDLRALTKLPKGKETTEKYLARIVARGPRAITAKLCDRLHNLRTLGSCSPEKKASQIKETRSKHLLTLIPALRTFGEPWASYAQELKTKMHHAIREVH